MIETLTGLRAAGDAPPAPAQDPAFDAGRACVDASRLSFPRRAGTRGERRAAVQVARAFAAAGLSARRESFGVPLAARETWSRLILTASAALAAVGGWTGLAAPAAACCWGALAAVLPLPWRLSHWVGAGPGDRPKSQNVLAALPFRGEPAAPARVVFVAHHDSKSQPLPTGVRVGLVAGSASASALLAAWNLAAAASGRVGPPWWWVSAGAAAAVVAAAAALALNVTGNRSPGALDNASGVGTLLELARTWRPRPGAAVEPLWLATGAEETGLDGARDFVRRHEAWCRAVPTLIINLDSVGAGGLVYLAGAPGAVAFAGATADRLGLRWRRLRLIGAGADHLPFTDRGLSAVSLLGDVVGRSMSLHSPRDTVGLIEPDAVGRAGALAAEVAWAWAERQRPAGPPHPLLTTDDAPAPPKRAARP